MLMHAVAHGGCTNTISESASKVDSGRNPLYQGIKPVSVLHSAFQPNVLPTELSHPLNFIDYFVCICLKGFFSMVMSFPGPGLVLESSAALISDQLRNCVKVKVVVLGSLSLGVVTVSLDINMIKQH